MTPEQDAALGALSDPTRRAIVEALMSAPRSVGELADGLPVTRPAVSQHLARLGDAGLVQSKAQGTRRIYRLAPEGAEAIRHWLDEVWDTAMRNYAAAAEEDGAEDGRADV